jgi:MFS family permease
MRSIGPILVDISREYGISVGQAGGLGAAYSLPAAFLSLLFGPLSDRYGRRKMMLLGLGILALTSLGSAVSPSFIFLLSCRILAGVGAAAVIPSTFASFGDTFPYSERGRAMAWQVAITTMSIVVGLPAGALLAGLLSWRWMFGLLTLIFCIVATLVLTRLPHKPAIPTASVSGLAHYRNSFTHIFRSRSAMSALAGSCLFGLFWQDGQPIMVPSLFNLLTFQSRPWPRSSQFTGWRPYSSAPLVGGYLIALAEECSRHRHGWLFDCHCAHHQYFRGALDSHRAEYSPGCSAPADCLCQCAAAEQRRRRAEP